MAFSYAYDRTDELVSVQKAGQAAQSFAYDSRGNLTGDAETGLAVTSYAYDLGNRLTGIDAAGTANDASYAYDALGRIASRTVNSVTDTYSYAGATAEAVRILTGSTALDSAVDATAGRLAAASGSTVNFLLPDLHGSVAGSLSSDQSTVTSATRYDAYGDTIATGAAGGTPVGNAAWRYQGRLDISPSGLGTPLYAMGARLYDPGVGAFTSLDTVAGSAQSPLSMNRFLYAQADPTTLVDPTGHSVIDVDGYGSTLTVDQRHKPSTHHKIVLASASRLREAAAAEGRLTAQRAAAKVAAVFGHDSRARVGPAAAAQGAGCSAARFDCTYADIDAMTLTQRAAWVGQFQGATGSKGWLNAIDGVVTAADTQGLTGASWFGKVDARILANIQAGYLRSQGADVPDVGGVTEWTKAWQAIGKNADPDVINHLVANAESASIVTGRAEAKAAGRSPTLGEAAALTASDTFRVAQRNRGAARTAANILCGPACWSSGAADNAVDAVVDERDFTTAFVGASTMFGLNNDPGAALLRQVFPGDWFDKYYPR